MSYTPGWVDKIQNDLSIPTRWIHPIFNLQWGWGTRRFPNPLNFRVQFFQDTESLYENGLLFIGFQFPFFLNIGIRWGNENVSPNTLQTHIGWRPIDGAPVIVFRVQDDSTRQGGLAVGFEDGAL